MEFKEPNPGINLPLTQESQAEETLRTLEFVLGALRKGKKDLFDNNQIIEKAFNDANALNPVPDSVFQLAVRTNKASYEKLLAQYEAKIAEVEKKIADLKARNEKRRADFLEGFEGPKQ